jgi:hypothetical protein
MSGRNLGSIFPLPKNVTYRQFDYWVRIGLIRVAALGGTGNFREISETEREVLKMMGDLVADGVAPRTAERFARAWLSGGSARIGSLWLTRPSS